MRFSARVFDPVRGVALRLTLEATNEAGLREDVRRRGLTLLALRPAGALPVFLRPWSLADRFDVSAWCTEMARLLRAGMSLPEALEAQELRLDATGNVVVAGLYSRLRERLLEGKRLSEAMRLDERFPPMLIAAVQASERTGRIANALEEFARHEMALRELRRRVVNAAIYPLLVVVFGLMVSLFLLGYVVPRFSQVFAESSVKLTVSTATILTIGSAINHHAEWVISSLFASAALIAYAIRSPSVRRRAGDLLSKLPPVQRWVRELQLTRITHALAMLLANGFTIPDAMQLASALALRPDLRSAMDRATSHIVAGAFTSAAWQQAGIAEPFAVRVLQAGERTGELGACFESLSQTYRLQVETKLERASRFAEPLLLILVASLIGTIVVLMYIPIVDLATSIG